MIQFITQDNDLLVAISEVLKELPGAEALHGTYELKPIGNGLSVEKNGDSGVIGFGDRRALMRAVSVLAEHIDEEVVSVTETPKYNTLSAMPDASRNAVPTVDTLKRFCRILALEGFNALMLYTEDTYEIKKYPYFGHLRGRYTEAELKELDDYANLLGIELIPAIQTLAHLNGFFEWPDARFLRDCDDILLVGSEDVYELIEEMLITMKHTLRTRKINLGLDEAQMLGMGRYREQNGFEKRYQIMQKHLARVYELCMKHGLEPRMWSDMFFRVFNRDNQYRIKGANVPPEIVESVPEGMTLVYWDYYNTYVEAYDDMFRQHKAFKNTVAFAGGTSSWYGLVPLSIYAKRAAMCATESLRRNDIKEAYVTMWGDDGGSCSLYASLPSLFIYGEACWGDHDTRDELAAKRMKLCCGLSEQVVLDFEELHNLPGRQGFGRKMINPSKYMFYANIMTGKFDAHTPDGTAEHMAKMANVLRAERDDAGEFGYMVDSIIALCDVLAIKSELGKTLRAAYLADDKATVKTIADETIPAVKTAVERFRIVLRDQWMTENKAFGFDVIDVRIGGVLMQLDTAVYTLNRWLDGEIDRVEELEADRLEYWLTGNGNNDGGCLYLNRWERMAGQNISHMVGY